MHSRTHNSFPQYLLSSRKKKIEQGLAIHDVVEVVHHRAAQQSRVVVVRSTGTINCNLLGAPLLLSRSNFDASEVSTASSN